ncbi:MAG: signal peptidase I [bacterium]
MLDKIKKYLDSGFYRLFARIYMIFVFLVIIFSANIFGPWHSFTNKSDSMNPAIDRGSLTIVKSFPKYNIGDVISYYAKNDGQEEIITHRVMDIGGNVYTTKGDANDVADRELVKPRLIIGKVVFVIPYLGHAIAFAKSLIGTWLCIIIPAMIILGSELIRIFFELEKIERERRSN